MDKKDVYFSDVDEILPECDFSRAARLYKHANRSAEVSPTSPAEVLQASGLVGCGEGAPDLSENYKQEVKRRVEAKYGHR